MLNDTNRGVLSSTLDDHWEEDERRHNFRIKVVWGTILALLAVAGAVWYAYPSVSFNQLASVKDALTTGGGTQLAEIRNALAGGGKRLDAAEAKLNDLANNWDGMKLRMAIFESQLNSRFQAARQQTRELIMNQQRRMQAQLDERIQGVRTRLDRVEAGQESQQARVSRLEQELADARQENARQVTVLQQDRDRALNQIADLDRREEDDNRELTTVHTQIDRRRVDFEAGIHHSRELVPGITLQVDHTSVGYQRFDGWVFLMPDRRTIWVHDQSVQRPLEFYSREDGRSRELVITRVTKYSVVGYVVLPEDRSEVLAHSCVRS